MILVIATLTLKPDALDALKEPLAAGIAATRQEAGCLAYDAAVDVYDSAKLVILEKWETREALTAHSKTPHLAKWREASAPHVVSRKIEIVHVEKTEIF